MGTRLVSRLEKSFALSLAVMLAASPLAAASLGTPTGGSANTLDESIRLNTAITVTGESITLGDIFDGYLPRPEKVVAQAPKPGQRMTLTAEWLADVARTYGIGWRPANSFDRAVVHQPGATITAPEIVASVKKALVQSGLPAHFDLAPAVPVNPVTIAATAPKEIEVREAMYDAGSRTFSALVQIPPGDPRAVFIPVRGAVYPTTQVPVLKQAAGKTTTITAEMIDFVALPEDQVKATTILDPSVLIGKTPKSFVRAGQPVRDSEVAQVTLVEVPTLAADIDRDQRISRENITMVLMDADRIPRDAVTTPDSLVGKSARRALAANVPIRRADVAIVHEIEVPVVTRNIPIGSVLTEADITWKSINEADVIGEIVMDEAEIVGQLARLTLRADHPVRRNAITKPTAVTRGQAVTVLWSVTSINLTAQGLAMEKGGVGDVIRVTNTKSNQTMLAEIIDSRTVRVAAPDQVSAR